MRIFQYAAGVAAILFCSLVYSIGPNWAHEGHDHSDSEPAVVAGSAPNAEGSSGTVEIVVTASGTNLLIYVDRFATNAPVEGATVEIETPNGPAKADAQPGGPYRLEAPWLEANRKYDLIVTVSEGDRVDIVPVTLDLSANPATQGKAASTEQEPLQKSVLLGASIGFVAGAFAVFLLGWRRSRPAAAAMLFVLLFAVTGAQSHEGHDHGEEAKPAASNGELAERLPDGTVYVPKSVQRIFALRTILTENSVYRRSRELPGRIIADPNASGNVQAAIGGRLSPPENGFPRLGTSVNKGDVLAFVTPPLQAIDVSTMRQQQGDLDQQISIVTRRLERYRTLAPSGAIARAQLEEAELEIEGLRTRRASLDKVKREPEELIAPVSGVIAEGTPIAGQIAQPNAVIFQIIDPKQLWIEALSFDTLSGSEEASGIGANGQKLSLAFRGTGLADRTQSIPVHYAVNGNGAGLRVGQFVTVLLSTSDQRQGVAVPRTSLVRGSNGQDFVYEHVSPQHFVQRPVRAEPLDGERVLLLAGVKAGARIVVQGAELLDRVR